MSSKKITIVDYGLGNLFNVVRSFERLNADITLTSDPKKLKTAEKVVLPGVGAFAAGMKGLYHYELSDAILEYAKLERPLLGICLGMQLLMESSEEHFVSPGLSMIEGVVDKLKSNQEFKTPHIGWNRLVVKQNSSPILKNLNDNTFMYFVHSYVVREKNKKLLVAETLYGEDKFCSVIQKNNIYGCQFHPERSGAVGLKLLENFLKET